MLEGIDVSVWNRFLKYLWASRFGFVGVRACYADVEDSHWKGNLAFARKRNLPVLAYGFGVNGPVGPQVSKLLSLTDGQPGVLSFLDWEAEPGKAPMRAEQAAAYVAAIALHRPQSGLYHSLSGFPDLGQSINWVAAWGMGVPGSLFRPGRDFHQDRLTKILGVSIDHNLFNGTRAQVRALAGLEEDVTPAQAQQLAELHAVADGARAFYAGEPDAPTRPWFHAGWQDAAKKNALTGGFTLTGSVSGKGTVA
jgi:hypothetical protein